MGGEWREVVGGTIRHTQLFTTHVPLPHLPHLPSCPVQRCTSLYTWLQCLPVSSRRIKRVKRVVAVKEGYPDVARSTGHGGGGTVQLEHGVRWARGEHGSKRCGMVFHRLLLLLKHETRRVRVRGEKACTFSISPGSPNPWSTISAPCSANASAIPAQ